MMTVKAVLPFAFLTSCAFRDACKLLPLANVHLPPCQHFLPILQSIWLRRIMGQTWDNVPSPATERWQWVLNWTKLHIWNSHDILFFNEADILEPPLTCKCELVWLAAVLQDLGLKLCLAPATWEPSVGLHVFSVPTKLKKTKTKIHFASYQCGSFMDYYLAKVTRVGRASA